MNQSESKQKMTQAEQILHYLQTGHTLTALDALNFFNCFRLSARISELRSEGHPIVKDWVVTSNSKKMIARYRIKNKPAQASMEMPISKPSGKMIAPVKVTRSTLSAELKVSPELMSD